MDHHGSASASASGASLSSSGYKKDKNVTMKIKCVDSFSQALIEFREKSQFDPDSPQKLTHAVVSFCSDELGKSGIIKTSQFFSSVEAAKDYMEKIQTHTNSAFSSYLMPVGRFIGWPGEKNATVDATEEILREACVEFNARRKEFLGRLEASANRNQKEEERINNGCKSPPIKEPENPFFPESERPATASSSVGSEDKHDDNNKNDENDDNDVNDDNDDNDDNDVNDDNNKNDENGDNDTGDPRILAALDHIEAGDPEILRAINLQQRYCVMRVVKLQKSNKTAFMLSATAQTQEGAEALAQKIHAVQISVPTKTGAGAKSNSRDKRKISDVAQTMVLKTGSYLPYPPNMDNVAKCLGGENDDAQLCEFYNNEIKTRAVDPEQIKEIEEWQEGHKTGDFDDDSEASDIDSESDQSDHSDQSDENSDDDKADKAPGDD